MKPTHPIDLKKYIAKREEIMRQDDIAVTNRAIKNQEWINNFFIRKFWQDPEKMKIIIESNEIWQDIFKSWKTNYSLKNKEKIKWL